MMAGVQAAHGRKLLETGQGDKIEQRVSVIDRLGLGALKRFSTTTFVKPVAQFRGRW